MQTLLESRSVDLLTTGAVGPAQEIDNLATVGEVVRGAVLNHPNSLEILEGREALDRVDAKLFNLFTGTPEGDQLALAIRETAGLPREVSASRAVASLLLDTIDRDTDVSAAAKSALTWWEEEANRRMPTPEAPAPHTADGISNYARMLAIHQALARNRRALAAEYGEQAVLEAQKSAEEQLDNLMEGAFTDTEVGANRPMHLNSVMRTALSEEAQHGKSDGVRNAARVAIWGIVKPPSVPQLRPAVPQKR